AVGRQDRDLRLVDDRRGDQRAERAVVRDRIRAAREIVGFQASLTGPTCDLVDRLRELRDGQRLGLPDHWRDEALGAEIDGDREVHVRVQHERVTLDARVQVRKLAERLAYRARDERQIGQRVAATAFPGVADL